MGVLRLGFNLSLLTPGTCRKDLLVGVGEATSPLAIRIISKCEFQSSIQMLHLQCQPNRVAPVAIPPYATS